MESLIKILLEFYTRLMGLVEVGRIDQIGLNQLRAGRSMLDLVPPERTPDDKSKNVDHVCLGIEAWRCRRLRNISRRNPSRCWASQRPSMGRAGWDFRFILEIRRAT